MKIYDYKLAPNPRRVRVFLAEKGLSVPLEEVDIFKGINRQPDFLKKNSLGGIPVLELDDGRHLAESVAICRYFELLHPGARAVRQGRIRAGDGRDVESADGTGAVRAGRDGLGTFARADARANQADSRDGRAVAQGCRAALPLARSRARGQAILSPATSTQSRISPRWSSSTSPSSTIFRFSRSRRISRDGIRRSRRGRARPHSTRSLVGASVDSASRRDTHPLVVALVIFLGAVELGGGRNLRDDRAAELAGFVEALFRFLGRLALMLIGIKNRSSGIECRRRGPAG